MNTQIEYIKGADNTVPDSLSRVESISLPVEINLNELAEKPEADEQLKALRESSDYPLSLKRIQWGPAHTIIFCKITGETIRPYIPESLRETVFNMFHKAIQAPKSLTDSSGSAMYGLICTVIFRVCIKYVWTVNSQKFLAI